MEPHGFLHDKLDVKVLILFILARIDTPLDVDDIYTIAYQDDSLNYFVLAESLPELRDSGHLTMDEKGRYSITEKGRTQGSYVEDSLAIPVVQKVTKAINDKKNQLRRDSYFTTAVTQDENEHWIATLNYLDDGLPLMRVSLMAPSQEVGEEMAKNMRKHVDIVYKTCMDVAVSSGNKRSKSL